MDDLNLKIGMLENKKVELLKKKNEIELTIMDLRNKAIREKVTLDNELISLNAEIAQKRREYKAFNPPKPKLVKRLTDDEKKIIIQLNGNKCAECPAVTGLTVHHKVPLSQGGTNLANNLQVLCEKCHGKHHRI